MKTRKKQYDFTKNNLQTVYRLFFCIPICKSVTKGYLTTYSIFGLPVWKARIIADGDFEPRKTRYYLFGLPVAEIFDEYESDSEEICDEYDHFSNHNKWS